MTDTTDTSLEERHRDYADAVRWYREALLDGVDSAEGRRILFPLVTRTAPYTTREDKHRMPGTVAVLERDELFELIIDAYRFGFTHAVLGSVDLETHTRIVSEQE